MGIIIRFVMTLLIFIIGGTVLSLSVTAMLEMAKEILLPFALLSAAVLVASSAYLVGVLRRGR